MALQYHAEKYLKSGDTGGKYIGCDENVEWILKTKDRIYLNTKALVKEIIEQKLEGISVDELAYRFHEKLAEMLTLCCVEIWKETGRNTVALSGGVFQNTLLLGLCENSLEKEGFQILIHRMIPPNDGGISIGQALYASFALEKDWKREEM